MIGPNDNDDPKGRFIVGDALETLRTLPDDSIDLVVTSPPYADARRKQYGGPAPAEYLEWYLPIAHELKRLLRPTGSYVLNLKEGVVDGQRSLYVLKLVIAHVEQAGLSWHDTFIWHKPNPFPGRRGTRLPDAWEPCYQFVKGGSSSPAIDHDANRTPIAEGTAVKRARMALLDADGTLPPSWRQNAHDNPLGVATAAHRSTDPTAQAHNHITIADDDADDDLPPPATAAPVIAKPYIDHDANRRPISDSTVAKRAYTARLDRAGRTIPSESGKTHGTPMGLTGGASRISDPSSQAHNHLTIGVLAGAGRGIEHPAMFPEKLPAWFIALLCPPTGTVLDPFAGAGTTCIAADRLGRPWIGIDRSAKYIAAARLRLERDRRRRLDLPADLPPDQARLTPTTPPPPPPEPGD